MAISSRIAVVLSMATLAGVATTLPAEAATPRTFGSYGSLVDLCDEWTPSTLPTAAEVQSFQDSFGVTLLFGDSGDNLLKAESSDTVIIAFGGNDKILGGSGNDYICAGDGLDVVYSGSGDDEVDGGEGPDVLVMGSGENIVTPDPDDILCVGAGGCPSPSLPDPVTLVTTLLGATGFDPGTELATLLAEVFGLVGELVPAIADAIGALGENLEDGLAALGDALEGTAGVLQEIIETTLEQLADALSGLGLGDGIADALGSLGEALMELVEALPGLLGDTGTLLGGVGTSLVELVDLVLAGLDALVTAILSDPSPENLGDALTAALAEFGDALGAVASDLGDSLLAVGEGLALALDDTLADLDAFLLELADALGEALGELGLFAPAV